MESAKLNTIIQNSGLSSKEIAKHLYPEHKHPKLALNRVIKGEGSLSTDQVKKLASLAGITLAEAYSGEWRQASKEGVHVFTNEEYEAQLDTKTWITKIFHKKSLFHEAVIHSSEISIKDYINKLNSIILNHLKND